MRNEHRGLVSSSAVLGDQEFVQPAAGLPTPAVHLPAAASLLPAITVSFKALFYKHGTYFWQETLRKYTTYPQ